MATDRQRHQAVVRLDKAIDKAHEVADILRPMYKGMDARVIKADIRLALAKDRGLEVTDKGTLVETARGNKAVKAVRNRADYIYAFITGERKVGQAKKKVHAPDIMKVATKLIKELGKAQARKLAEAILEGIK